MMKTMAWMTLSCSVVGGILETFLIRKIMEAFLRINDFWSAQITAILFVGLILPTFVITGLYAKRHLRSRKVESVQ